jgi:agmatinase/guanidinopropionase
MAFAGIPSFMRLPVTRELAGVDVAIVGVPFDSGANSWRSGTRLGPRQIRANSLQLFGRGKSTLRSWRCNFDLGGESGV